MKTVSVIMVSYYTGPALQLALESALQQPECKEVILVDNGNTPGERAQLQHMAEQHAPRLQILDKQGNVGFGAGCNLGAKQATGDYILLLNPDSVLPKGGLARSLEIITHFPAKTLAGCYLLNVDGSEQRGNRRALLTPQNALIESLGLHHIFSNLERLNYHQQPMPETVHKVASISGAFMFISRAFYEELHGLDEGYFLHMEDMDLCYRVNEAGGTIICMPEVCVLHFRSTSDATFSVVEKHKTRGFIRYFDLHFFKQYPSLFRHIIIAAIWTRYALKYCFYMVDRLLVPPLEAKDQIARLVRLYRLAYFLPQTQEIAGKTLLVTGPSGQIGLQVVGIALAKGANVIALYNNTRLPFEHPRLRWVQQGLSKEMTLPDDLKADILVNTPSLKLLPQALPMLIKATGIKRLIAISSTSIEGKASSKDMHEKEMIKNLVQAETEVCRISKENSVETTLLRPTMIYGAGIDRNICRLANMVRRFGTVPIYQQAKGFRHPVQSVDVAGAVISILSNEKTYGKTYNIGGGESLTYRAMLERIFQYIGKKPRLIQMPFMPQVLDTLGFVYQTNLVNGEMARRMNQDLVFDISDAVRDFGFHPHNFLEGDVVI